MLEGSALEVCPPTTGHEGGSVIADIKIYVSCHKDYFVPPCGLLFPVQAGAALADRQFPGKLQDNQGENISALNRYYCELTVQYWAWKNQKADWFGFFHYRRYLNLGENRGGSRGPYSLHVTPSHSLMRRLGYLDGQAEQAIQRHQAVLPLPEEMGCSAAEHYSRAPFHHRADLELICRILRNTQPLFVPAMEEYLRSTRIYFGNLFVMKAGLFDGYCRWLFGLLAEFDRQKNTQGYSPQELRVDGYLAERLLGVYVTWLRGQGVSILEVPRAHFEGMEGGFPGVYCKKRLINLLLPPESRRRLWVKQRLRP